MLAGFNNYNFAGRGNVFCAYATVTAPAIYSGTAQNGLLLWNGSAVGGGRGVTAFLLAASFAQSVVTTVAGAIGMTGAAGQPASPTGTTPITLVGQTAPTIGAVTPACTPFLAGTVVNGGQFFQPLGHVHTGALTVDTEDDNTVHLGGMIAAGVSTWAGIAASATLTTAVMQLGLVWMEIAND